MSEREIRECPFCGSANVLLPSRLSDAAFVECARCNATGPYCEKEADAIAAWNAAPRLGTCADVRNESDTGAEGREEGWLVRARPEVRGEFCPIEIRESGCVHAVTLDYAMQLRAELNAALFAPVLHLNEGHDHTEYIDGCPSETPSLAARVRAIATDYSSDSTHWRRRIWDAAQDGTVGPWRGPESGEEAVEEAGP